MLLAELDANGWATVVGAIGIVLVQLATMVLSYLRERAVAGKVEQVRKQTAVTAEAQGAALETIQRTGEANHVLLNNNMHLALAETLLARMGSARLARKIAEMDPTSEHEVQAAEAERLAQEAEVALQRHDAKQRTVDEAARPGAPESER